MQLRKCLQTECAMETYLEKVKTSFRTEKIEEILPQTFIVKSMFDQKMHQHQAKWVTEFYPLFYPSS